MKRCSLVVLLTLGALANAWGQGKKDAAIMAWADSLTGQERWLKVDVLRLEDSGNSKDPTNIDMESHVYYRAAIRGQMPATQTKTVEEFEEAVRVKFDSDAHKKEGERAGYTWKYVRGTKVRIEEINLSNEDIKIDIKEEGKGKKTALRLKFEKKEYTLDEVRRLYAAAFADSEGGVVETVNIELGMTPEQVIAAKGQPISRTNLGPKVILTYKDMKMIFQDGKLVDVQ